MVLGSIIHWRYGQTSITIRRGRNWETTAPRLSPCFYTAFLGLSLRALMSSVHDQVILGPQWRCDFLAVLMNFLKKVNIQDINI